MSQPLAVECRNLGKRYPHFALRHVDLTVEQGTVMGLVGPNGAGKSTILRMVMGLLEPGQRFGARCWAMPCQPSRWPRSAHIGFVAEDMRLYESQTIEFHMEFVRSIFDTWDGDYARALLRSFDLNKAQKVKGLSHGQRVKATLLLALARRPKLLVFDEPTTGLDPAVRKEVIDEMMNALEDEAHSILFSSHNTLDVEQISDYITFIYDGRIIESSNKEDFMDGWRRIRLTNARGQARCRNFPNIKAVQHEGPTVQCHRRPLPGCGGRATGACGLRVDAVERLTLEEIFLSNVLHAQARNTMEAVS